MIITTFIQSDSTNSYWSGTRSEDGFNVTLAFPIGWTSAQASSAIESYMERAKPLGTPLLAPTLPVASMSLRKDPATGNLLVLDENGKTVFSIERDVDAQPVLYGVDTSGGKIRYLRPQGGTIEAVSGTESASIAFETPFTSHPSVVIAPSDPLPNHKLSVSKTGFEVAFETPLPAKTTIAFNATGKK